VFRRVPRADIALLGDVSRRGGASRGGTAAGLIRLSNALEQQGVKVAVWTAFEGRFAEFDEKIKTAIEIRSISNLARPFQLVFLLVALWRDRPRCVVARDSRAIDLALLLRRLVGARFTLVCAVHNVAGVRTETRVDVERRKRRRFQSVGRLADGVLAVSPGVAEMVEHRLGQSGVALRTIPNPAFSSDRVAQAKAHPVSRPLSDRPHFINVARLQPEKGHLALVDAFERLFKHYQVDACLTVLGDGAQKEALRRRISDLGLEDRVFVRGFVTNPLSYMADADVFVLASIQEAFGYVLVEALAMGLSVVATDCPHGPRFILENGRYGYLVDVDSRDALAEGMQEAVTQEYDAGITRRRQRRAEDFAPEAVAQSYLTFFEELGANRH